MCGEISIYKGNFVRKEAIPERAFSPERSVRMGGDLCLQTFPPFPFCEFSLPPPRNPQAPAQGGMGGLIGWLALNLMCLRGSHAYIRNFQKFFSC